MAAILSIPVGPVKRRRAAVGTVGKGRLRRL
jgi:hypothetical protein